jgi:hypothetical protein
LKGNPLKDYNGASFRKGASFMLFIFFTVFSILLTLPSTGAEEPLDSVGMPDYRPSYQEQQAHIDALLAQLKKKLEDGKKETHILESFSQALGDYRSKHIGAVYEGFKGAGSGNIVYGSSCTAICIKKKQVKELEFLLNQKQDPFYVRVWLEDAEAEFWENMKPLLFNEGFLEKVIELVKTKEKLPALPSRKYFDLYHDIFEPKEKERIFKNEEWDFFESLEIAVHEAFLKVLDRYKSTPVIMQAMLDGHSSWLSYRLSLLKFCESMNVDKDMIKLRLICLNLARLHFYERFLIYFEPGKGDQERCLASSPREYNEMYDCDIVRKPKGLSLTEPCFPNP